MQVFAREPVGSVESCNLAPDLPFLALQTFGFRFVRGELLQICLDKRGDGRIALGCGDPGALVSLVVNCDCDIAHVSTVSQYSLPCRGDPEFETCPRRGATPMLWPVQTTEHARHTRPRASLRSPGRRRKAIARPTNTAERNGTVFVYMVARRLLLIALLPLGVFPQQL